MECRLTYEEIRSYGIHKSILLARNDNGLSKHRFPIPCMSRSIRSHGLFIKQGAFTINRPKTLLKGFCSLPHKMGSVRLGN